jgi:hypothetical protein
MTVYLYFTVAMSEIGNTRGKKRVVCSQEHEIACSVWKCVPDNGWNKSDAVR